MSTIVITVDDGAAVVTTTAASERIVVQDVGATGFVLVGQGGLQGPPGPAGQVTEDKDTYLHAQPTPSSIWIIQHNLGYDPGGILVVDQDDFVAEGWDVTYTIPGVELVLTFGVPCAGTARLS